MGFAINDKMLSNFGKLNNTAERVEALDVFKITPIDIHSIEVNDYNFYAVNDIEVLKEDIKENGLLHNIVVREISNNKYEILSGERRYTAYKSLFDDGDKNYKFIPCKVVKVDDDINAELILIKANATARTLSPAEILTQIERSIELYKMKKERGDNISGTTQNLLSKDLSMGARQVAKYQKLSNNLSPQDKEIFLNGDITLNEALVKVDSEKEETKQTISSPKEIFVPDIYKIDPNTVKDIYAKSIEVTGLIGDDLVVSKDEYKKLNKAIKEIVSSHSEILEIINNIRERNNN